jgi:hypothetical protein
MRKVEDGWKQIEANAVGHVALLQQLFLAIARLQG